MPSHPKSVDDILNITSQPIIAIDDQDNIIHINDAFTAAFGWTQAEVAGQSIIAIVPTSLRACHEQHFEASLHTDSCVVTTKATIMPVMAKNGDILDCEHYILGQKYHGHWRFAATITPPA